MQNIIAAMIKAQKLIKHASIDANNPHYKSRYATLESVLDAVKSHANANAIAIIQSCSRDEKGDFVETVLMHESGEHIASKMYLFLDKPTMQGMGSAITYSRRYQLASLFGISQADDDANEASIVNKNLSNKQPNTFFENGPAAISTTKGENRNVQQQQQPRSFK